MQATRWGSARGAAAVAFALLLGAAPARAEDQSRGREAGLGFASGLASMFYAPVKIFYAFGGLLVGGAAFALSGGDQDVAGPVLDASVRGDYVITPKHLVGDEELEFIGRSPRNRKARQAGSDW
jgi:hypothetical protein